MNNEERMLSMMKQISLNATTLESVKEEMAFLKDIPGTHQPAERPEKGAVIPCQTNTK